MIGVNVQPPVQRGRSIIRVFIRAVLVVIVLILSRFATLLPIRWWMKFFRFKMGVPAETVGQSVFDGAGDHEFIGGYINVLERYMPWRHRCLPSAVAGALLYRRYRIASKIVLGVSSRQDVSKSKIHAHAWLVVGSRIITGLAGARSHKPVAVICCNAG